MMFYVLLVWLLAGVVVVTAEFAIYAVLPRSGDVMSTLSHAVPPEYVKNLQSGLEWNIALAVVLGTFASGYLLEQWIKPVHQLYLSLQKTYPAFYRRWPADWRELRLAWILAGFLGLLLVPLWLFLKPENGFVWLLGWMAFTLGLSLSAILNYRQVQTEDRPEKPPQAVIHHWIPAFPMTASFVLGRLYLRYLLPLLLAFMVLLVPIILNWVNIQETDYIWILGSLWGGLVLANGAGTNSVLHPQLFGQNWLSLSWRLGLALGFLLFGLHSGNWGVVVLFGGFGGYLLGTC